MPQIGDKSTFWEGGKELTYRYDGIKWILEVNTFGDSIHLAKFVGDTGSAIDYNPNRPGVQTPTGELLTGYFANPTPDFHMGGESGEVLTPPITINSQPVPVTGVPVTFTDDLLKGINPFDNTPWAPWKAIIPDFAEPILPKIGEFVGDLAEMLPFILLMGMSGSNNKAVSMIGLLLAMGLLSTNQTNQNPKIAGSAFV